MTKKINRRTALWIVIAVLFVLALFLVIQFALIPESNTASSAASSASSSVQSAYSMVGSC